MVMWQVCFNLNQYYLFLQMSSISISKITDLEILEIC